MKIGKNQNVHKYLDASVLEKKSVKNNINNKLGNLTNMSKN